MTSAEFSLNTLPDRFHRRRWARYVRRLLARMPIGADRDVLGCSIERLSLGEWTYSTYGSPHIACSYTLDGMAAEIQAR